MSGEGLPLDIHTLPTPILEVPLYTTSPLTLLNYVAFLTPIGGYKVLTNLLTAL